MTSTPNKKTNSLLQREQTMLDRLHAMGVSLLLIIVVGVGLFSFAMRYNISTTDDGGGTSKEKVYLDGGGTSKE